MSDGTDVRIRPATERDVPTLHRFVVELTGTEPTPPDVTATPADLADALFGERPLIEAAVAEIDGRPVGSALFYPTYSTVLGRGGLHLEDLYVEPGARHRGVGRALLGHLARLATDRGCARLEWWVLRTNADARRFYERARARGLDEIDVMRLDGDGLRAVADT